MKKSFLILSFLTLFFLSFSSKVYAGNYAGVRMYLTEVGNNNYKITFLFFRDCSAISPPSYISLSLKCSANSNFNYSVNLQNVQTLTREVTPACHNGVTHCYGGSLFGVQEVVYEAVVILVPCDHWTITYANCCRLYTTNLSNTNGTYLEAYIDNMNFSYDNCIDFHGTSVWVANQNKTLNFNPAVDVNSDDSISFDFYAPFTNSQSTPVQYNSGYNYQNFMSSNIPITIDHTTGQIKLEPTGGQLAAYGIKISRWRKLNGVTKLVSRVYDDIVMKVYNSANHYPLLSGMIFDGTHDYDPADSIFFVETRAGDSLDFNIAGFDPDTFNAANSGRPEIFSIKRNYRIVGDTFTVFNNGTDSAWANFRWKPSVEKIRTKPYYFSVEIRDSACGYNGFQRFTYAVKVLPPLLDLGADTTICIGQSLVLQGDSGNYSYLWSTGDTTRQITVDGSVLSPGTYQYWLKQTGYGSTQYDTITVVVQICEGIGKLQNDDFIAIAPNPNNGIFEVLIRKNTGKDLQMEVFDSRNKKVLGKTFKTNVKNKSFRVDLSGCAKGLYFLRFYSADFSVVKKVVLR